MPSRAELNLRAYAVGIDAATIPNDSKLEQQILYAEKNTYPVTGTVPTTTLTSTGTAGNTETFTLGGRTYTLLTTLTGAPNEILIGAAATNTLDNIKEAINGTGTPGTNYSQATKVNEDVVAGTKTATTLVITSRFKNTSGALATTETMANFSFTGATLGSGVLSAVTVAGAGAGAAAANTLAGVAGDRNTSV